MNTRYINAPALGRGAALLAAAGVLLLGTPAAGAADAATSKPTGIGRPVTLEPIAGTKIKRVILSPKAAERLGIEVGKVGQDTIVHRQMVSGLVTGGSPEKSPAVGPGRGTFGGFAAGRGRGPGVASVAPVSATSATEDRQGLAPSAAGGVATASQPASAPRANARVVGDAWIQVSLSPSEWERLAKDKPARLLPLATRDAPDGVLLARPSGLAPVEDPKRSMLSVYYIVPGTEHGLLLNSRMRVELQVEGTEQPRKVVPYGALHYDGKGEAWVYVNTAPLTFERRRVTVERVVGDLAVLSDGPETGTEVVTVGAPLLFGAEVFGK